MSESKRIVFVGPSLHPFSNQYASSYLGELAAASARAGHDVTVISLMRQDTDPKVHGLAKRLDKIEVQLGSENLKCALYEGTLGSRNGNVWLIDGPEYIFHDKDDHRTAYILAKAAISLIKERRLEIDVLHTVGWQSGLFSLLARNEQFAIKKVHTLLDNPLSGVFPAKILDELHIGREEFHPDGIEFYGQASLQKAAIIYSDSIVVVSSATKTTLKQKQEGESLYGLFNTIDNQLFAVSPGYEQFLKNAYDDEHPQHKLKAKASLQQKCGLRKRKSRPLVLLLCENDKELETWISTIDSLKEEKLQFLFCGPFSNENLGKFRSRYADVHQDVAIYSSDRDDEFLEELSGADALLLAEDQSYRHLELLLKAYRFATIPLINKNSAGIERLVDYDRITQTGTGFLFEKDDDAQSALIRLMETFAQDKDKEALIKNISLQNLSWDRPLALLEEIYAQNKSPR